MKKGELTTQQIVTLIILIASFAVILYFIFNMGIGQEQDKELCHNSVLMRDNALIPDEAAPLNCKRQYVCISADKTCESMTDPVLHKVKDKNETFEVLAQELADCWWMFGEGKVNYAGKDLIQKWYCAQCAQISFDDSMKEIFPDEKFSEEELYQYLVDNKVPRTEESYAMYFYGTDEILEAAEEFNLAFEDITLDKSYYVLTAMHSEFGGLELAGAGAGAGAIVSVVKLFPQARFASLMGGVIKSAAAGSFLGGGVSGALSFIVKGKNGLTYLPPSLVEAPSSSEEFKAFNCKELTTYA